LEACVKERLTGAVILVAILVLLVPELLTGPGSGSAAKPAGAEGVPLRSYTIDLADDANRTASAPTGSPAAEAVDEPVVEAAPEPGVEAAGETAAVPPNDAEASNAQPASDASAIASAEADERHANGQPSGSGADSRAATPAQPAGEPAEDDRPRSAFGPNAANRTPPEPAAAKSASSAVRDSPDSAANPASSAVRRSADSTPKPAATRTAPSKGWAVQLGVFASRDNADRLSKQLKGKGYPVTVNEISGNGKRLWRVRVGPEAGRPAADALRAKLRAEGHKGATVVGYP
jgi:DedD protein